MKHLNKIAVVSVISALILAPSTLFAHGYGMHSGHGMHKDYMSLPFGFNLVRVSSCEQVGDDIRISLNNGPKQTLTSSIRDAGYGLRSYDLVCLTPTRYLVQWMQVGPYSATSTTSTSPTAPVTVNVSANDYFFSPQTITVKAGSTVVWTNHGGQTHTVTADDNSFNSGNLSPGQTYTRRFDSAGTYRYYCQPHSAPGGFGMSGIVVVTN